MSYMYKHFAQDTWIYLINKNISIINWVPHEVGHYSLFLSLRQGTLFFHPPLLNRTLPPAP